MPKKKQNIYNVAYTLGINYLDNFDYNPRYTVMFDIDDTLLLDGEPNKPILKLLKECNKRKIKVVIITTRSSIYTQETIFELEEYGDSDYLSIFLKKCMKIMIFSMEWKLI